MRESTASMDALLREAIAARHVISFAYKACHRIAEPHDYGIHKGIARLFFYQIGGESRSTPPVGWRWATLAEMSALTMLEQKFAGSRPAPSGRHIEWDELIASVSSRKSG